MELNLSFFYEIYSELLPGNLRVLLPKLSELDKLKISYKIVRQVAILHHLDRIDPALRGITHGDLKLQNILLDKDNNPFIIDWGLSKLCGINTTDKCGGTHHYYPPEVIHPQGETFSYNTSSFDVWCLGVLLHYLFDEPPPWYYDQRNIPVYLKKIKEYDAEFDDSYTGVEKVYKGFLRSNPQQRMSPEKAEKILGKEYRAAKAKLAKRKIETLEEPKAEKSI